MKQIDLTGVVGWDVGIEGMREQFADATDVRLMIHSPGGEVYDGIAIHNLIRDHVRKGHEVVGVVTGLAASMATYIAMACSRLEVEDNAVWMIHNPWTIAWGDHRDLDKAAKQLDALGRVLGSAYARKTGQTLNEVRQAMDDETWLYGEQIATEGFADAVIPAGEGAETQDDAIAMARARFGAMSQQMQSRKDRPGIDSIAALLPRHNASMENPMSEKKTAAATDNEPQAPAAHVDPEQIAQAAIARERERIAAITARCAQVKMDHMTADLIASGATLEQANAAIVDAWAESGGPEIQPKARPEDSEPVKAIAAANAKLLAQIQGVH